jgi:hypothetical protein
MNWVALLAILTHLASGEELGPEECRSLGLNKAELLCSSCDDLSKFGVSSKLTSDCKHCCNDDGRKLDATKYPKAILEVCG